MVVDERDGLFFVLVDHNGREGREHRVNKAYFSNKTIKLALRAEQHMHIQ